MSESRTIHATTIVLGEAGVLIRGEAGSGKSSLARELIREAGARNAFGRLVADDRTRLEQQHGRLLARPVDAIAGCIEVRGIGIVRREVERAVVVRLIVDLAEDEPERWPAPGDETVAVCGVLLPRIRARTGANLTDVVMAHASGHYDAGMTK